MRTKVLIQISLFVVLVGSCLSVNSQSQIREEYIKGLDLRKTGDLDSAFIIFQNCLNEATETNDLSLVGDSRLQLGIVKDMLREREDALFYFRLSLRDYQTAGDSIGMAKAWNLLGLYHSTVENVDSANWYLNKSLEVQRSLSDSTGIFHSLLNLGLTHKRSNRWAEALKYYRQALSLGRKIGVDQKNLIVVYNNLGSLYKSTNVLDSAEYYYKTYLKVSESLKLTEKEQRAHKNLYNLYTTIGELELANFHVDKYISLKDSVYNTETLATIHDLELKYETEKKENELQQAKLEQQRSQYRNRSIIAGVILLALIIIGYLVHRRRLEASRAVAVVKGRELESKRVSDILITDVVGELMELKDVDNAEILEAKIDRVIDRTRDIAQIHHNPFVDVGLKPAIEFLCKSIEKEKLINISTSIDDEHLQKGRSEEYYRIIESLILNGVVNQEASQFDLDFSRKNGGFKISLSNNSEAHPDSDLYQVAKGRTFMSGGYINTRVNRGKTLTVVTLPK